MENHFLIPFSAKKVFVGGPIFYASGMFLMALFQSKVGVVVLSGAAGIMYSTLFTMPYLLVANYHAKGVVSLQIKTRKDQNFVLILVWINGRRRNKTSCSSAWTWYRYSGCIQHGVFSAIHVIFLDGHYRKCNRYNDLRCNCSWNFGANWILLRN